MQKYSDAFSKSSSIYTTETPYPLHYTLPKIVLAKQTLVQFVAPTGVAMRGVVVMVRIFIPKEKIVSSVIRKCLVQADSQKQ